MENYRKNDFNKVSKHGFCEPQNCWFLVSVPEKLSSSSFGMVKTMSKTVAKSRKKHVPLRHLILQLLQDVGHLSSQGWRVPTSSFQFSCWNALWPFCSVPQFLAELWNFTIWSFWDGDVGEWGWYSSVQTDPFLYPSYITLYFLVSYNIITPKKHRRWFTTIC